jgi:hypothetical protein
MNVRRIVLDVDKAVSRPSLLEIAAAVEAVPGVQGLNITVTEIDVETVGTNVTIEGEGLNFDAIVAAIERTGAVVHSIDQIVAGKEIVEGVARSR